MTEQETREALTALGQQAQRLRASIQAGRLQNDDARRAIASQLEKAASPEERLLLEIEGLYQREARDAG